MLLPFQGANRDGYNAPRVSAHVVRLALGYVLMAFQAVPTQGVGSHGSPCPGLCAFGPSGRSCSMSIPISIDYALLALLAALFITSHLVFLIHQRAP